MLFAPSTVFNCPSCKKDILKRNFRSYTIRNTTVYSDGYRTGLPFFTPNLAKCPNCGAVFFLHNLIERDIEPYEESNHMKDIDRPSLDDYIKAITQDLCKNKEEETEARLCLWRELNHKYRRREELTEEEKELYKLNCATLIIHLTEKANQYIDKMDNDEIDGNERDFFTILITIAECYRNIDGFDKCMEIIDDLPESYKKIKAKFAEKCAEKDCLVFAIN